jgi:hypothetical protein
VRCCSEVDLPFHAKSEAFADSFNLFSEEPSLSESGFRLDNSQSLWGELESGSFSTLRRVPFLFHYHFNVIANREAVNPIALFKSEKISG